MKKLIFTITCVVFAMTCLGQNIIQVSGNQGNASEQKDDCPYRINGICSTEDIGGVMVDFKYGEDGNGTSYDPVYLHVENYNSFPVTVLIEYHHDEKHDIRNVVLTSGGHKAMYLSNTYISRCTLQGMIVRKLSH